MSGKNDETWEMKSERMSVPHVQTATWPGAPWVEARDVSGVERLTMLRRIAAVPDYERALLALTERGQCHVSEQADGADDCAYLGRPDSMKCPRCLGRAALRKGGVL